MDDPGTTTPDGKLSPRAMLGRASWDTKECMALIRSCMLWADLPGALQEESEDRRETKRELRFPDDVRRKLVEPVQQLYLRADASISAVYRWLSQVDNAEWRRFAEESDRPSKNCHELLRRMMWSLSGMVRTPEINCPDYWKLSWSKRCNWEEVFKERLKEWNFAGVKTVDLGWYLVNEHLEAHRIASLEVGEQGKAAVPTVFTPTTPKASPEWSSKLKQKVFAKA